MNNRNEESFSKNLLNRLKELAEDLDYEILRVKERKKCNDPYYKNDPYFHDDPHLKELKIQKACMEQIIRAVTSAIKDSSTGK